MGEWEQVLYDVIYPFNGETFPIFSNDVENSKFTHIFHRGGESIIYFYITNMQRLTFSIVTNDGEPPQNNDTSLTDDDLEIQPITYPLRAFYSKFHYHRRGIDFQLKIPYPVDKKMNKLAPKMSIVQRGPSDVDQDGSKLITGRDYCANYKGNPSQS